jgi:hypothetical protein
MPHVEVKRMQVILTVVWLIAIAVILMAGCQALSLSFILSFDLSGALENIASRLPDLWPNGLSIFT